jgi:Gpi18-like mannosyltransferase
MEPRLRRTPALVAATVIVVLIVVLAVVIRVELFPFQSNDYRAFVAQWYDFISANGGFSALRYQFANYNVPYLYLIALLTYLPVPVLAGVKTISVLFDLLLAFYAYKLVALKYPRGWLPFAAAAVVSLLPTVVMNGSMWAQCDSIYAAFGLGGLYYAVRSRPWLACVFFGLALSFKLQIVFLLPVLAVLVLRRKIPWPALVAVPGVVLAMDVPALLVGASPSQLLSVYTDQVGEYSQLTLNAPNVYQLFDFDPRVRTLGIFVTGVLVLALVLLAVISRAPLSVSRVVLLGTVFVILVPFFLPAMHERYFFLADVLSVIVAFYVPRRLWAVPVLVQFASAFSYVPFLSGRRGGAQTTMVDFWVLALAMLAALVLVVWEFAARSPSNRLTSAEPPRGNVSRSAGRSPEPWRQQA